MSKTVSLTMCCGQLSFDGVSAYEQALQNRDIRVVGDTSYVIHHNSVVMMTAQPKADGAVVGTAIVGVSRI